MSIQEGVVTTPLGAVLPRQCLTALLCRQVEGCLHPGTALHRKASLQSLGVLLYNSVTWIFSVVCGTYNMVWHDLKILFLLEELFPQMFLSVCFSMPISGLAAEPVRMSICSQSHGLGHVLPLLHLWVPIWSLDELGLFSKPAKKLIQQNQR